MEDAEKQTRACPACGEEILVTARKCKHCQEWIDNPQHASGGRQRGKAAVAIGSLIAIAGTILLGIGFCAEEQLGQSGEMYAAVGWLCLIGGFLTAAAGRLMGHN